MNRPLSNTMDAVLDGLLRAEEDGIRYTAVVLPSTWARLLSEGYVEQGRTAYRLTTMGRAYVRGWRKANAVARERRCA